MITQKNPGQRKNQNEYSKQALNQNQIQKGIEIQWVLK